MESLNLVSSNRELKSLKVPTFFYLFYFKNIKIHVPLCFINSIICYGFGHSQLIQVGGFIGKIGIGNELGCKPTINPNIFRIGMSHAEHNSQICIENGIVLCSHLSLRFFFLMLWGSATNASFNGHTQKIYTFLCEEHLSIRLMCNRRE